MLMHMATEFSERVWKLVGKIPKGKVTTYGGIAGRLGRPGAGRAVGQALKRNPHAPIVPCHRVVKSDGGLGGYGGSSPALQILILE
jgi:O-6-methylguanine DNA methyltransferase